MSHRKDTTPAWWAEADPPTFDTEEEQQRAKVAAAGALIGFLLNVSSESADAQRVKGWLEPEDFPGVYAVIARAVWDDYDGDVHALALRMIANGRSQAIANGALLTDLYWNSALAGVEHAGFVLTRIRMRERQYALAARAMSRLLG
jgi:hypothetical protein